MAITYDDSENIATFYINGEEIGIRTVDWQINDTIEPLTFGYEPGLAVGMGDGNKIASVTMYNHIIPEPATLSLFALGVIALLRKRKY